MKLIHLSDLHLGKRVNGFPMIEDQTYILTKIINVIDEEKPEGKLISAIIDTLDEMASEVADLKQENDRIYDYLDELDHDLGDVESELYELDDYYDDDDEYYDDEDLDEEEEEDETPEA